jgi:hypothetical protein
MEFLYILWAITGGCWPPDVWRVSDLDPNDPAGVRGGTPPVGYLIAKLLGAIGGVAGGFLVSRVIGTSGAGALAVTMAGALVTGKVFTELAGRFSGPRSQVAAR